MTPKPLIFKIIILKSNNIIIYNIIKVNTIGNVYMYISDIPELSITAISSCTSHVDSSRWRTWAFHPTHLPRATWKSSHLRRWGSKGRRKSSRNSTTWVRGSKQAVCIANDTL